MAEECEKIVEVRKIAKSKDLSSAVTVISKENEKNTEEINNLKDIIKQMMSTSIAKSQPILDQQTISALNRVSIAKIDRKFRSGARENRKMRDLGQIHLKAAEVKLRTTTAIKNQIKKTKNYTKVEDATYAKRKAIWQGNAGERIKTTK
jgi:hypothetical protein